MKTKTCSRCHTKRTLDNFYKSLRRKDGFYPQCKICCREQGSATYAKNPEPYKRRTKEQRAKLQPELLKLIDEIRVKYGCAFCQEKVLCVLDFHHYRHGNGYKNRPVSRCLHRGRGALIHEINKCIVTCANCHRKLHAGLLHATANMCCNEPVVYKPRIYLPKHQLKRCVLQLLPNKSWLIKFIKPHSILDRSLVLSTEKEQAMFAAECRRILAPSGWNGDPTRLPRNWCEQSLQKIKRCPAKYYDTALPAIQA